MKHLLFCLGPLVSMLSSFVVPFSSGGRLDRFSGPIVESLVLAISAHQLVMLSWPKRIDLSTLSLLSCFGPQFSQGHKRLLSFPCPWGK